MCECRHTFANLLFYKNWKIGKNGRGDAGGAWLPLCKVMVLEVLKRERHQPKQDIDHLAVEKAI